MKETYGLEQSIEEICTGVMSGIEFAYRDCIQCKPSVVDMLEALSNAGVAMCVATATRRDCALAALERLDILKYFSALFTCTEVGASKTEPDIFELALAPPGHSARDHVRVRRFTACHRNGACGRFPRDAHRRTGQRRRRRSMPGPRRRAPEKLHGVLDALDAKATHNLLNVRSV